MTKEQMIDILRLLSALEGWSFVEKRTLPEPLQVDLRNAVDALTEEILK